MPKIVDHEEKREEILSGCFELFARRGYSAVTMREIAEQVGVSTGTLYHYFPTKNDLFQRMFQSVSRQDIERATEELGPEPDRGVRLQRLFRFLAQNKRYFHHVLMMALDYYRHDEDDRSRQFVRETVGYYRQAIAEQLNLKKTGLEKLLFSFLVGTLIHEMLDPEETDLGNHESFLQQVAQILLPA